MYLDECSTDYEPDWFLYEQETRSYEEMICDVGSYEDWFPEEL